MSSGDLLFNYQSTVKVVLDFSTTLTILANIIKNILARLQVHINLGQAFEYL